MYKKNHKLDRLAGSSNSDADTLDAPPAPGGTILLVYAGVSGPDQAFGHTGPMFVIHPSGDHDVFGLDPGLNIVDAALFNAYKDYAPIVARGDQITEVKLDTLGPAKMRSLAKLTEQPEALELLLEHERAKPVSAGPNERRNADVIAIMERRLRKLMARKPILTHGMVTLARSRAQVTKQAQPDATV